MGWSGGTDIARNMVTVVKTHVADTRARRHIYATLIDSLESADWDTQCEAKGIDPIFDQLLED